MKSQRSENSNRPDELQTRLEQTYNRLEKLSRLHIAACLNAVCDPTEHNINQALKLDKEYDKLFQQYDDLYCRNELIIHVTHPNKLN